MPDLLETPSRTLPRSDDYIDGPDQGRVLKVLAVQSLQRRAAELVRAAEQDPQRVRGLGGRVMPTSPTVRATARGYKSPRDAKHAGQRTR